MRERMTKLIASGVVVNACKPCLTYRKIELDNLLDGISVIEGPIAMAKKDDADKLLCFL